MKNQIIISGFSDEIAEALDTQIEVIPISR